jgi:hypothetical protein
VTGRHDRNWAGAGFTQPGLESDPGYRVGYALGKAEAFAGMTTIFDDAPTSFIDGHNDTREHLARGASGREAGAS